MIISKETFPLKYRLQFRSSYSAWKFGFARKVKSLIVLILTGNSQRRPVFSKKTDSVEQHLLNMISILSSRFYLGLYAFKRKAYFVSVIMNSMQCLMKVWYLQQADFMNTWTKNRIKKREAESTVCRTIMIRHWVVNWRANRLKDVLKRDRTVHFFFRE